MTKLTLLLSLAFATTIGLTACNKSSDSKTAETAGPVDTTQMQNPNIPTQQETSGAPDTGVGTAEAFYSQFLYRTEGACPNGQPLRSFSAINVVPVNIGRQGSGQNLGLKIALNIYANGTYQATYQELSMITEAYSAGSNSFRADPIQFQTGLSGRWTLDRNQISFQGLGVGGRFRDGNSDKILLKVNQRFNRPEALNSLIPLQMAQSQSDSCRTNSPAPTPGRVVR